MSAITEAEDEIKAIAWSDMVKSKTRERELQAQIAYLRAGVQRIADGYGGDVASFAQNLLDGKV